MHLKNNEHNLQKKICGLLSAYNIFCFETDVMDGLKFCKNQQLRLSFINHHKKMGYKKGQSDLIILFPNEVIFVEIKNGKKGVQSDSQKTFQKIVEKYGFQYIIWRNLDDCIDFITKKHS